MSKYRPIRSEIARADQRRRNTRRYNDLISTFTADVERFTGRAISEAERQLISDASLCAVVLEAKAADVAAGNIPDVVEMNRLSGTKTRALRRLGLLGDLPRPTVQRQSQNAREFVAALERRQNAEDAEPDPLQSYAAGRQARIERIAQRVGADPSLFDASKGGRLDVDEVRALLRDGRTKELKRLVREARTQQAEALAAQRADDRDDDDRRVRVEHPAPKVKRDSSHIRRVTA